MRWGRGVGELWGAHPHVFFKPACALQQAQALLRGKVLQGKQGGRSSHAEGKSAAKGAVQEAIGARLCRHRSWVWPCSPV